VEEISEQQLRNDGGAVMRRLDGGEAFLVTRNGVPVGELRPLHRRRLVLAEEAIAAFRGAPSIDGGRFRSDIDRVVSPQLLDA
jgi:antitoxin (DNA-binding transcriptional repressor) of toxin-antitoxin stability system